MNGPYSPQPNWHSHFAEMLVSGNQGEIAAAAAAAQDAQWRGADHRTAVAAGKAAARAAREGRGTPTMTATRPADAGAAEWSRQLAPRLFAPPARWGWEAAAVVPVEVTAPPAPPPRPVWVQPQSPDTSGLRAARAKAISRVVWRLAFTVVAVSAFVTYQVVIEAHVAELGSSAAQVYRVGLIAVAALFAASVLRALSGVHYATRAIRNFHAPYEATRHADRMRYEDALRQWEQTVRRHQDAAAQAAAAMAAHSNGARWFPVAPVSEPTRVDVFGGDPHRHGWASLLTMVGSSLLAAGDRVTVLDLTGQEFGDNLVALAGAARIPTSAVRLDQHARVHMFGGLTGRDLADCLSAPLTEQSDGDRREERAMALDVLRRVLDCLAGTPGPARIAAGVRVLLRGTGDDLLTTEEIDRLVGQIGDIDQNEWTTRQLRFLASRLDLLPELANGSPLWTGDAVTLISTEGGRGDRKELIDRLLLQVTQRAMTNWRGGLLVVAGVDHLGATAVRTLAEHARYAKVRLMLMIDQPQGDLEKVLGTGGAVCLLKMYNHRDAAIAAEFIGKEHTFVISQVTRQVGSTFTDGGGDSFAANTGASNNSKQRRSGTQGRPTGLADSRGHTWTGTRNWSNADNVSTSTGTTRVYEFTVDPQRILGLPETSFLLVDNTGSDRRVVLADCNPGICLLDRVSATPMVH
ncbi:MAG TPA: hypothetical protein VGL06_11430 [Pseudonocardiaceae bacterium]